MENYISHLRTSLCDVVQDTMNQVRKKQTRTMEEYHFEKNQNFDDNNSISSSSSEEENYNPKNLPLGWDGKPIPYWLYKIHGLGIEYKCEICGNF